MNPVKKTPVRFVEVEEGGQRIDNFLLTYLKDIPKSHVYRLLRKGEVRVNKKRIKPDYRLQTGDLLRIPPLVQAETVQRRAPDAFLAEVESSILYEDKHFIVVNKPAGLAVHGGSGISFGVIEALRQARPKEKFLELVHRLDRETSGCLLLAKRPSILREVHQLLREKRGIQKVYLALLAGEVNFKGEKLIQAPLQKFELQGGERVVRVDPEGKASETLFQVIERFKGATLVQAKPITGRTHQIRVHAAVLACPIAGDEKYGRREVNREFATKGLKRLFLHAKQLSFTLASTGKEYLFEAPLSPDLETFLAKRRQVES